MLGVGFARSKPGNVPVGSGSILRLEPGSGVDIDFPMPLQPSKTLAVGQAERWFYSGMEAVLMRCCCDLADWQGQIEKRRVRDGFAVRNIPPQPGGAKFGQGAGLWYIIDPKSVPAHRSSLSMRSLILGKLVWISNETRHSSRQW